MEYKYQVTAPMNNRKHRNVGVMRTTTDIKSCTTSGKAYNQKLATLAYPATTNSEDGESAYITEEETSKQTPDAPPKMSKIKE
jgi:hypothetical protein